MMTFASCVLYQNGRRFDTKRKAFYGKMGGVSIQNARGLRAKVLLAALSPAIAMKGKWAV
jgi:hypothetical protein